jgi:predicted nucleic acid-binding protein
VIGVLIRAKHEGRILSLQEELDRLRNDAGFWIGDDIYSKALRASGEGRDRKE